ncbi:MAG: hypothetical protein P1U63_08380 [Coxiellaceae bacterium]|nr:hypothetical protein [Coxiellaceae bacterium]
MTDMLDRGYIMQDCRDARNFIVRDGVVHPIDFGQVHTEKSCPRYYSTYKRMVVVEKKRLLAQLGYDDVKSMNETKNKAQNTEFLQQLCKKAQTKVHNRFWSLGIAGKRVQVGDKSYVVPGYLAATINHNKNKTKLSLASFKLQLLIGLKQNAKTKVNPSTSRDVWTKKLYDGKLGQDGNANTFFRAMLDDKQPKQAYKEPVVSSEEQSLTR